jgi:RimJ/RimL family protein N-acetyltransferase
MKHILATERLTLREMALDDLDFVAAMLEHPENIPSQSVARSLGMAAQREVDFKGFRHIVFAAWQS